MQYYPDFKEKSPEKSICRKYFWTILFSAALKFARATIDEACQKRDEILRQKGRPTLDDLISSDWIGLLEKHDFVSCK